MARYLIDVPPEDRQVIWDAMMVATPGSDELAEAMAAADPLDPRPSHGEPPRDEDSVPIKVTPWPEPPRDELYNTITFNPQSDFASMG